MCGSEYRVEMHHVRFLKDLNPNLKNALDKLMASRKRKQIPLCRECHMEKHRKLNKGPFVEQRRNYHYQSLKRKGKQLVLYEIKCK